MTAVPLQMTCRCSSCKNQRARIRTELARCTQYSERGQRKRKNLESYLQSAENTIHSRFCRLPVEIQTKIFQYATTIDGLGPVVDPTRRVKRQNRFLVLGAVCHLWRSIAWGTPLLWKSISIYIYQRNPKLIMQLAQEWLERSEPGVDLNILLYTHRHPNEPRDFDEKVATLVEIINSFSHRWGTLSLEIPLHYAERVNALYSPRMLKGVKIRQNDFVMEPPAEEGAGAPWFRQQKLMVQVIGHHHPGMTSVKRLDFSMVLNDAGIAQALYYAFLAASLEDFTISGIHCGQKRWHWLAPDLTLELMSQPITRRSLRALKLERVPTDFVLRFLEWAKFPNLETLTILEADLTSSRTFDSFLSQCSTSLKALHLGVVYDPDNYLKVHDNMLVNTLASTPYLQHLNLSYSYYCPIFGFPEPVIYDRLLHHLTREVDLKGGERPLLPYLQFLQFQSIGKPKWAWDYIPMLFYPPQYRFKKWGSKFLPSHRPLRAINILIVQAEGLFVIELETLRRLSDIVMRLGVQFNFTLAMGEPAQCFDILKKSAEAYGLVWDRFLRNRA